MDWSLSRTLRVLHANSVLSSFFFKRTLKKKKLVPRANEVIGGASCKLQLVKISQIENVVQTFKLVAELFSCGVVEVGLTECYKVSMFTIEHRRN